MTRLLTAALGSVLLALVLFMTMQTRTDVDLWGHVRFGLDILRDGEIHQTDSYSFTSDRTWINHEWLAEILMAAAWAAGGAAGLILLKLACAAGALWAIASILKAHGVIGHPRVLVLGLTLLGILGRVGHVRPQLFSVLLFACLMRIFVRADQGRTGALLLAVPVTILWTNLHGGWLVGVATIALWCAGEAYALRRSPRAALIPVGCAALAAVSTLVNPYGVGLWRFLAETVRFGRQAIVEWGPIWATQPSLLVWIVLALVLAGVVWRRPQVRNPASLAIPILWALASIRVNRLDAFFALSLTGLLALPVATLVAGRRRGHGAIGVRQGTIAIALALALLAAIPTGRGALTCIGFYAPRWPEPEVVEFMRSRQLTGRLVTYFDWGEYALWHLHPGLKVSMDGRRETVYSDRIVARHLELYGGTPDGLDYLRELQADYVWLPRVLPIVGQLEGAGWTRRFEGPQSVVFARPGAMDAPPVSVTTLPASRCFPGP